MEKPSLTKVGEKFTKVDQSANRQRMASASSAAKPAFDAAVDYLNRRAEKGKLARSGPAAAPVFEKIAKSHARAPGRLEKGLVASPTTTGYLPATSAAYAGKGVAGLAKSAKHAPSGAKAAAAGSTMDFAASSAGVAFNGVALAASAAKLHSARRRKEDTIALMTENLEKARSHVQEPGRANAETAAAYRTFMAASRSVVSKGKDSWIESASDSNLNQHQLGATVARYAINTGSSVVNVAGACANTVAATPVGPFLVVGVSAAEIASAGVTLEAGRRKSRSLRSKLVQIESWRYRRKNAGLNLPVVGIYEACKSEVRRQERLADWVKRGAKIQIAKASGNLALGITGGVLAALGVAAVIGTAAITAGIAIVAVGSLVSAAYLGYVAVRTVRNARAERHCKRRQAEAQGLIATQSHEALTTLMGETDPQRRKATAITVERGGFLHAGQRALRVANVDVGRNAYVGLHLMAHELAGMVGHGNLANRAPADAVLAFLEKAEDSQQCDEAISKEQGAILRLLQTSGMSPFEIQTLCDAASVMKADAQLCYLKQAIAAAMGIPFRLAADGREKPLTPFAYLAPVEDLMADPEFAANAQSTDQARNFAAAKTLFSRVDFDAYAKAMADPVVPVGVEGSVGYLARKILADEKKRRVNHTA
jgi:hypothetical protein